MISVGGDGTLLEAVTHVGALETPILGINMGRLGFLATTARDRISNAIEALHKDYYKNRPSLFDPFNCRQKYF